MKLIDLTPNYAKEWDNIVYNSDEAWLFHLYDWIKHIEKVWDLKPKNFLIEHDGKIIGIFPLLMDKNSNIFKSTPMGAAGPALKNGLNPSFHRNVMKQVYEDIRTIASDAGISRLEIYLPPLSHSSINNKYGVNPLVNYYFTDISTHTLITDLSKSEYELYNSLSHDARINIRNAKENGFRICEANIPDAIDRYYQVHCETYHRTGVNPHPKEYFNGIFEFIIKKGHATLFEAINTNREPIGYEIIGLFKGGAIYWTGCSKTKYLDSGVNYFLQYNSMLWAKRNGALLFENGEAFPNIAEGKLRGLSTFKGKFGGELRRFYKGTLSLEAGNKPEIKQKSFKKSLYGILSRK